MNNNNIVRYYGAITREHRQRQNRHKSIVIWFTGLSGSGKSTLAHAVEEQLYNRGYKTFVLDGDNVRYGLSSDLGFSGEDRHENIRRIGEVAKLMMDAGIIVLTAFISPFRYDRKLVRDLLPCGDFFEVYCNAKLETCEKRDIKGLYKKARLGKVKNYTGIDSPYEEPHNPELIIDTDNKTVEDSVNKVISALNF